MLIISFADLARRCELTGLETLNFQDRLAASDVPLAHATYQGREPGPAWRRVALERFERLRTTPLAVRVLDSTRKPVARARVQAAMSAKFSIA